MAGYPRITQVLAMLPNSLPVPLLSWSQGVVIAVSNVAANTAIISNVWDTVVDICGTTDIWATVTANALANNASLSGNTCTFIPQSSRYYAYVPANSVVSVIQNSSAGNVAIIPITVGT